MYLARQLSFNGVSFDIEQVSLCRPFIDMYNASVKLVSNVLNLDFVWPKQGFP